jgi:uncharacterized membrane protein (UPF0182 family)
VIVYFGQWLDNYRRSHISGHLFKGTGYTDIHLLVFTKIGWATSWATFSQTHLVTLLASLIKAGSMETKLVANCLL